MAVDSTESGDSDGTDGADSVSVTDAAGVSDSIPHPSFEPYAAESLPAAAVGSPGKDGRLELAFAADANGETALVQDLARAPFHVSGTLDHDPHPAAETVYVQSPTGGVAQGDRLSVDVSVGPDAVAHVSTGSSTKVQSMTRNYAASEVSLSVESGGHLDYVPEPTILHADSRYAQTVALSLDRTASAVVGDVVVPGRLARGERFEFERYLSRFRVRADGDLLVDDATHLRPGEADPTAPGVLGEFAVLGTLYVIAPASSVADSAGAAALDDLSDRLHAATNDEARTTRSVDDGDAVRAGATRLPNDAGVVIRALGHRAERVTTAIRGAWNEARRELLDVGAPTSRRL